ncbi:hypothetical protein BDR26DRAFT_869855 [Obelidium mucronatum]|nr:hypothetical protein BDR26DRAFT_869855 [Obelidium mucronatum]
MATEESDALIEAFVQLLDLCLWITRQQQLDNITADDKLSFMNTFKNIASDVFRATYSAFPDAIFPWHENKQDPTRIESMLSICTKINNICSQVFDFETVQQDSNLWALPFLVKYLTMYLECESSQNIPPCIEWIPSVTRNDYLLRFMSHSLAPCFLDFGGGGAQNKMNFDCALSAFHHFSVTKNSIELSKRDLDEMEDLAASGSTVSGGRDGGVLELVKALLQVLASNPNSKERNHVLNCFTDLFSMFKTADSTSRNTLLHLVMTHSAVNVRSYGIYLYKNEIVEKQRLLQHQLSISSSSSSSSSSSASLMMIDPQVSSLLFNISSKMFSSPSYPDMHFLENDDVFFELSPTISQCLNFLSYLKQSSQLIGESNEHFFHSLSTEFVAPIRQRTKIMLNSRENALKLLTVDPSQCNHEISTLSLLIFQMEQF